MKVEQLQLAPGREWKHRFGALDGLAPQFVLVFGQRELLLEEHVAALRSRYAGARFVFSSTAGEICGTDVQEGTVTATAVVLEKSTVTFASTPIHAPEESRTCGTAIGRALRHPELVHVFVLCDGQLTNGTAFAAGLAAELAPAVKITGGLAGDGANFRQTTVALDTLDGGTGIVALGFRGAHLRAEFGCEGGWAPFGPERIITRSIGNQLFELDGMSALSLYKTYLGEQAAGLPGSALRFPLSLQPPGSALTLVRTILTIDESTGSMTFAGDMPLGSRVRLMRASQEDLIDGASRAAAQVQPEPSLVICVSCIGRRLVLGQRAEEETETVREAVGARAAITGFYSYGELAPAHGDVNCQLHNQTMTITVLRET
jgi:hypothetical protein